MGFRSHSYRARLRWRGGGSRRIHHTHTPDQTRNDLPACRRLRFHRKSVGSAFNGAVGAEEEQRPTPTNRCGTIKTIKTTFRSRGLERVLCQESS